jgi:hypothetical protein
MLVLFGVRIAIFVIDEPSPVTCLAFPGSSMTGLARPKFFLWVWTGQRFGDVIDEVAI